MTSKTIAKKKLWIGGLCAVIAVIVVYVMLLGRSGYSVRSIASISDTLTAKESRFVGRKRDFARYSLKLIGLEGRSATAFYRIASAPVELPAVVLLTVSADTNALSMLMDRVPQANSCAMLGINVRDYFARDDSGHVIVSEENIGRAITDGVHAVKLALDYLGQHGLIDSTAIYLCAEKEANLIAIPAISKYDSLIAGISLLWPESCWSDMPELSDIDFASPTEWPSEKVKKALIVSRLGTPEEAGVTVAALHSSYAERGEWAIDQTQGQKSPAEIPAVGDGLSRTVEWILSMRPVFDTDNSDSTMRNENVKRIRLKSSAMPKKP